MEKTKKLAEVDMAEYTDDTNLICEQNGSIKRVPIKGAVNSIASKNTATGEGVVQISDSAASPIVGLKIYGNSTQVTTTGAQLLKPPKNLSANIGGIEWKYENGYVTANKATDTMSDYYIIGGSGVYEDIGLSPGTYRVFSEGALASGTHFYIVRETKTEVVLTLNIAQNNPMFFDVVEGEKYRVFYRASRISLNNAIFKIMLCDETNPIEIWEPYTGGYPSPSAEYPQEIKNVENVTIRLSDTNEPYEEQAVNISFPAGLSSIDNIRDYMDFGNRKIIRKFGKILCDGSNDENWVVSHPESRTRFSINLPNTTQLQVRKKVLCNRGIGTAKGSVHEPGTCFVYDNALYYYPPADISTIEEYKAWLAVHPLEIIYPLEVPEEEDIEDTYEALHMYHPDTVVSADASINMEVEYVLDIKTYVDNKFLELAAQVLDNA